MINRLPVSIFLSTQANGLCLKLIYGRKFLDSFFIESFKIQRPGLALAGFVKHIHAGRVQILGETEISYLLDQTDDERYKSLEGLCKKNVACLIVTKNLKIPYGLVKIFQSIKLPLFRTHYDTETAIVTIQSFLDDLLAPYEIIHGNFIDVFGVGVLILGRSGIGKSECALELINRGHRLVADDAVIVRLRRNFLSGKSDETLLYHLEVRGLGVINIKEMFGISSVTLEKQLNVVIKFIDWQKDKDFDRSGLDNETFELFNIKIPFVILPVYPGRNMAVLVETAAKNYLLKSAGIDMASAFSAKLQEKIKENREELLTSLNKTKDQIEKNE